MRQCSAIIVEPELRVIQSAIMPYNPEDSTRRVRIVDKLIPSLYSPAMSEKQISKIVSDRVTQTNSVLLCNYIIRFCPIQGEWRIEGQQGEHTNSGTLSSMIEVCLRHYTTTNNLKVKRYVRR